MRCNENGSSFVYQLLFTTNQNRPLPTRVQTHTHTVALLTGQITNNTLSPQINAAITESMVQHMHTGERLGAPRHTAQAEYTLDSEGMGG